MSDEPKSYSRKSPGASSPSAKATRVKKSATLICDALQANAKYPLTADKHKCIEDTVRQLLDNGPHAEDPGLLLGCVQGGKTDTYEYIIAG